MAYRRTTEIVLEQPFAGSTITVIDRDGISTRSLTEITNAYSGRRFRFIDPSPFTPKPIKPTDSQNADNSVPQPARAETELECRNVLTILREIAAGSGTANADDALAEVARTWPKLATLSISETIDRPGIEKVVRYSSNNSKLAEVYLEKFDGLWNVTLLRI